MCGTQSVTQTGNQTHHSSNNAFVDAQWRARFALSALAFAVLPGTKCDNYVIESS